MAARARLTVIRYSISVVRQIENTCSPLIPLIEIFPSCDSEWSILDLSNHAIYSRRTGGLVFHFASFGLHQVLLQPRICRLLVWSFFTNFLLICKIFRKYVPGGFCYREWNKLLDEALLSPDVRLPVRLSVSCTFMYCFQTAEDIVLLNFLLGPIAP